MAERAQVNNLHALTYVGCLVLFCLFHDDHRFAFLLFLPLL